MEVQIGNRQDNHRISEKKIRQTASVILNALDYPDAELSILIVDDQQIAQLNRQYLNREAQNFPFSLLTINRLRNLTANTLTAKARQM
jgi:probable rRNA maturation factor